MTIDLEAIKARCKALDERMSEEPWTLEKSIPYVGLFSVYDGDGKVISHGIKEQQDFIAHAHTDIPALVAEVERLRASLEEILDEATSDLDRDIIITECQSALLMQPDALPCGHPREAMRGDVTCWCSQCQEEASAGT